MVTAVLLTAFGAGALLSEQDAQFLDGITAAVVDASRVKPGEKVGAFGPNTSGAVLIRPGGRDCYPAFWIRDYAMSLDVGLITAEEQRHALLVTASCQEDAGRALASGSTVPRGSIPDHITFDGKAIFYPGTLDDVAGQGGPNFGAVPPFDDQFYFIHMAYALARETDDVALLDQAVHGVSLWKRLDAAFGMPPAHETGIVYTTPETRGITFGFVDSVTHTGDLLFASLLKWQAATELAWLHRKAGHHAETRRYTSAATQLRRAIPATFAMGDGWLRAATGIGAQADVWGTAYAVYIGALPRKTEVAACTVLARAYRQGAIAWNGGVRHVPTTGDFSPETAWEKALTPKNRYQNGAYWTTPTGWACYAIAKVDANAARSLASEFIAELRQGDYRKGPDFGSPWECAHPDGGHRQNPVYMASVTCPLAAFRKMAHPHGR